MKKIFTLFVLALLCAVGAHATVYATYTVSLNNGATQTPSGSTFFTVAGSYHDRYKDATYNEVSYTKGLKMDSNGKLTFSTTVKSNVTYVQSTSANGTNTTKFGGQTVAQTSGTITLNKTSVSYTVTKGTNYIEYVFTDVPKGTYTIEKSSGECGLLFAKVELTEDPSAVTPAEITAVSINGTDISASDLATLKSEKAVSIDGSSLNGIGNLNVTLTEGSTTPTRAFSGTSAVYTFTINASDTYTVTFTGVGKTYSETGIPFYYKKDGTEATGANTSTVTANGITFEMAASGKTIQYGSGKVTIGTSVYVPIKLSTGSAMNVTFPEGTVATKVKVYGWSQEGNGKLYSMGETSELTKSVDVSSDIYYATNTASDIYPSVYEYVLDDYESFFFHPGGSPSQPFVVMEFTLVKKITPAKEYTTYVTTTALDFTGSDLKAYKATAATAAAVTMEAVTKVPAGTPLVLKGTAATEYKIPVLATADAITGNKLVAGDGTTNVGGDGVYDYILVDGQFYHASPAAPVAVGKAYLHLATAPASPAPMLSLDFGEGTTGINAVKTVDGADNTYYNLNGQRVAQPGKGLYIVNGKKVIIK